MVLDFGLLRTGLFPESAALGEGVDATSPETIRLDAGSRGEGHVFVWGSNYAAIVSGTWMDSVTASQMGACLFYNNLRTIDDEVNYKIYLDAATYTFVILTARYSFAGIMRVLIDGVEIFTQDLYKNVTEYNKEYSQADIVIATPGLKTVTFKTTSKNAASTGYQITWTYFCFWRQI